MLKFIRAANSPWVLMIMLSAVLFIQSGRLATAQDANKALRLENYALKAEIAAVKEQAPSLEIICAEQLAAKYEASNILKPHKQPAASDPTPEKDYIYTGISGATGDEAVKALVTSAPLEGLGGAGGQSRRVSGVTMTPPARQEAAQMLQGRNALMDECKEIIDHETSTRAVMFINQHIGLQP